MNDRDNRRAEWIPAAISGLGLAVLCFLYGAASVSFEIFPYERIFAPTFDALEVADRRWQGWRNSGLETYLWEEVDADERGVVERGDKAQLGYTFYSSGHLAGGPLVDLRGRPLHWWSAPFRSVWSDPPHIDDPAASARIYWEDVELSPTGDLLVIYAAAGERPRGYGLAEIGPDSSVRWRVPVRAHDDVTRAPDGSIRVLTHHLTTDRERLASRLDGTDGPLLVDGVVEVSEEGRRLGRLSLAEVLVDSGASQLLSRATSGGPGGPLGATSIAVADEAFADAHDFARPGQLVVALAGLDALVGIDPDRGSVAWSRTGPWEHPRSIALREDGDIAVLDAGGADRSAGPMRTLRYDPERRRVEWSVGGEGGPFPNASSLATQKILANGNVLVTDPAAGRIVEIVPGGGVVWSFVNPERAESESTLHRPALFAADRIPRGSLEFELNAD